MGQNTSLYRSILAQKLGSHTHVFCLSARDTQGNLYNEHVSIIEHVAPQADQESGVISKRRVNAPNAVSGLQQDRQEMDHADQGLEGCLEPIFHLVW